MSARYLNLSAYAIVTLDRLAERRQVLFEQAHACGLKGSVMLAPEGIKLFVAGAESGVRQWLAQVRAVAPLGALEVTQSWSDRLPFRRLNLPAALAGHRAGLEARTVVTYCTGGIRCEKAALSHAGSRRITRSMRLSGTNHSMATSTYSASDSQPCQNASGIASA